MPYAVKQLIFLCLVLLCSFSFGRVLISADLSNVTIIDEGGGIEKMEDGGLFVVLWSHVKENEEMSFADIQFYLSKEDCRYRLVIAKFGEIPTGETIEVTAKDNKWVSNLQNEQCN